jgi:hypothetical protein
MTIADDALEVFAPRPYAEVRAQVQDGDIFLCQGQDPFSRLIQWSTRSPWSHCAIAFRLPDLDRVIVIESVQNIGVRAVSLSEFCSRDSTGKSPYPGKILLARHSAFAGGAEGRKVKPMAKFAFDHLGARFAPVEIVRIGLRIFLARVMGARHTPKMLIPKDEFICSEFVAAAFEAAKVKVRWDGLGFVAPSNFALDPKVEAIAQVDVSKPPRPQPKPKKKKAGR